MKMKILAITALAVCLLCLGACKLPLNKTTGPTVTARPTVRVTVPEGYTVYKTAKLLEEKKVCAAADFLAAVNAPPAGNSFAAAITNAKERPFLLEGYVFPDTYDFYVGESAQSALGRFLANMKSKLTAADYEQAAKLGYTMDQIITIASIVQAESGFSAQDPKVSSVLHNRLNKSGSFQHLGFNTTFEYLDNSVAPVIKNARAKYNALYNTYVCKGLPAGPICNPGLSAIHAALYPAVTDYYYFLTDKNRNYYYSKTYAEQMKLWSKYKY